MATPNYLVGVVLAVSVDGTDMYATKTSMKRGVNVVKVTNAKSGGFQQVKGGIRSASGSVEVVYNGDDPVDVQEGDEVEIVWKPTGGATRTFPALITNVNESLVIDGDYTYSFDWESSGSFALPGA